MTDGPDRANDGPGPTRPGSDTFPEFLKYARNRQQKSARAPVPPPSPPPPKITAVPALAAVLTVIALCGIVLWSRDPAPKPAKTGGVASGKPAKARASAWIDLPRPHTMGQVPDEWGALKLGMPLERVDPARRTAYAEADKWADWLYRPDPANAEKVLGLSFHKGKLYKIAVRFGEDSTIPAGDFLANCQVAYGESRGYEYLTPGHNHAVTIFQTESRAIRLDSVKAPELIALAEAVLLDLEVATERELARARGEK